MFTKVMKRPFHITINYVSESWSYRACHRNIAAWNIELCFSPPRQPGLWENCPAHLKGCHWCAPARTLPRFQSGSCSLQLDFNIPFHKVLHFKIFILIKNITLIHSRMKFFNEYIDLFSLLKDIYFHTFYTFNESMHEFAK